jgi:hypothetical protein
MSEPENFLTRWSRRKRVADAAPEQPAPASAATSETPIQEPTRERKPPVAGAPAFDPASLPSLDSIGAQTDIRAFLQAGVPNDLKLAALRRAWSADPAIRDFKGLAENDLDFNDPNGIMGFGKLDPGTDVKKMLAQLFGETPRPDEPPAEIPATAEELTPESSKSSLRAAEDAAADPADNSEIAEPTPGREEILQRKENLAAQDDGTQIDGAPVKRRGSHGGALPQ